MIKIIVKRENNKNVMGATNPNGIYSETILPNEINTLAKLNDLILAKCRGKEFTIVPSEINPPKWAD